MTFLPWRCSPEESEFLGVHTGQRQNAPEGHPGTWLEAQGLQEIALVPRGHVFVGGDGVIIQPIGGSESAWFAELAAL